MNESVQNRLGPYELNSPLGAGGMGEVFRARDTRLNREVAVKVLPKEFVSDADRLRRFEQEAKTLASLNHPNVLTVFDAGVHEGAPYLVSELLEGKTLRELLGGAATAALPVRKATEYALQIAHGLAAAHGKGVIHRDLKPENIFVTKDGRVKILDFGLAKLKQVGRGVLTAPPDGSLGAASPTTRIEADTIINTTEPGMVLGTPAYMSPEQVRGEPADHRADIFAFGCVLYEMLSGTRAFRRNTPVESMNAVLREDPTELAEVALNVPAGCARVLHRCLEKQPDRRFQSASDLAFALEGLSGSGLSSPVGTAVERRRKERRMVANTVITVAILALVFLTAWKLRQSRAGEAGRPRGILRKFEVQLPVSNEGSSFDGGDLVISPDGRKLVYSQSGTLWVKWLDRDGPPVLMISLTNFALPFWSPSSSEIGFFGPGGIYRVSVSGGQPSLVCAYHGIGFRGVWTADGNILFSAAGRQMTNGIYEVSEKGGEPQMKLPLPNNPFGSTGLTDVLPAGLGFLMIDRNRSIEVLTTDSRRRVVFQQASEEILTAIYSPSGHILFDRLGRLPGLWALPFSLSGLKPTGEPFRIADKGAFPSMSADGTLVFYRSNFDYPIQLVWINSEGIMTGKVGEPIPDLTRAESSPDERRIVVETGTWNKQERLWLLDPMRPGLMPLTLETDRAAHAFWLSDNQRVLFTRRVEPDKESRVWVKSVDNLSGGKELFKGWANHLSRDGNHLVLRTAQTNASGTTIQFVTLDGSEQPVTLPPELKEAGSFRLSPDGRLLGYYQHENDEGFLYLVTFPEFGNRTLITHSQSFAWTWHPNGTELLYIDGPTRAMMSVPVKRSGTIEVGPPVKLFEVPASSFYNYTDPRGFSLSSDGKRFLMQQEIRNDADKNGPRPNTVMLVENWFEEYREKK